MSKPDGHLNLGRLTDQVLVFGGPYSNLAATLAIRQQAEELEIPPDRVICTGDLVAYCAEPCETLQLVRDWGIQVVQGNCEESLGEDAQDCGCGFEEGTTCSALSVEWYQYANRKIGPSDRRWMRNLPKTLSFNLAQRSIMIVHGGVNQINRFIFPSTPVAVKQEELDLAGTDILIGGHSGIPCGQLIGNRAWLNAGVIGLPANDSTLGGWYLLLTPMEDLIHFSWHRLSYPAETTCQKMLSAGLKGGYIKTLKNGLWPSMDVLPTTEREQHGIPIEMKALMY